MKSMRLTALACLLALMLPLCIACGGEETPGGTAAGTTAAETTAEAVTEAVTTDYLSTLPTADFDGASYVIAAQSTEQRPNLPGEEENGEVLNDALIQRNRKTADLYNVTIENLIYAGKPDPANAVKKAVIGVGHGEKQQIHMMVKVLMPRATFDTSDAADALAIAICHAHRRNN